MNSEQLEEIMGPIRPALFAMYGQQKLMMRGFKNISRSKTVGKWPPLEYWSGWFEIYGEKTKRYYIVRLMDDAVVTIGEGRLELEDQ